FNLFFMKGRSEFCKILASITTNMYFYIQPFEPYNFNLIKTRTSEFFNIYKEMVEKEGIPFLIQTINIYYKNLKEKDPNIRFEKSCPKGNFIRPDDIGMDLEEFLHGVFFDINHETPLQKIDQTKILSIGIGRETKFIK
ncbi:MAG: hypothetical protein ACTSWR_01325, partial [Candidatus Helarchaeota archaeon]